MIVITYQTFVVRTPRTLSGRNLHREEKGNAAVRLSRQERWRKNLLRGISYDEID